MFDQSLIGGDFWLWQLEIQFIVSHLSFQEMECSHLVPQIKNPPAIQETWVRSVGWEDPLEKGMAIHSSILAWRIPWTEELGRLQSMGSQWVRHNWATFIFISVDCPTQRVRKSNRKIDCFSVISSICKIQVCLLSLFWASPIAQQVKNPLAVLETQAQSLDWRNPQPAPVFLPEKFHEQRSLVGYSPWGRKELDTAEC